MAADAVWDGFAHWAVVEAYFDVGEVERVEDQLDLLAGEDGVDTRALVVGERAVGVERALHHPQRVGARAELHGGVAVAALDEADPARRRLRVVRMLVGPGIDGRHRIEQHRHAVRHHAQYLPQRGRHLVVGQPAALAL